MNRGDVFYVSRDAKQSIGSEIQSGRPANIVSTDLLNHSSGVVEVVFLTTQEKPQLATHAKIYSTMKPSTALCEQVDSISKSRIGDYICTLSPSEMDEVDRALSVSFGLPTLDDTDTYEEDDEIDYETTIIRLETERDCYKEMLNSLLQKGAK